MFRAFAEMPVFLDLCWSRMQSAAHPSLEEDARHLSRLSLEGVRRSYFIPNHKAALERAGLGSEAEPIRQTVRFFDALNPRLFLLLTALLMSRTAPSDRASASWTDFAPAAEAVELAERASFASGEVGEELAPIYDSIREALGLSEPPDEYAALSRWPEYLSYAWNRQKPMLRGSRFGELSAQVTQEAAARVRDYPEGQAFSASELKAAGLTDPQTERAQALMSAFYETLPPLMLLTSAFRVGLEEAD
jgi:hypothetical protein